MTPKRPTPSTLDLATALRPARAIRLLAAVAAVVLSSGAAIADDDEYATYFEFQVGVAHVPNQSIDTKGSAATNLGSVQPNEHAPVYGGAIGRRITDLLRAEIAVTYRDADLDQAGLTSGVPADGDLSLLSFMANGYVDFDLGSITPWIGAGIGGGIYKIDVQQETAGAFDIDDGDPVFVYNVMTGVTVPVNEVFSFSFAYRYIAIAGEEGSGAIIAPSTTTTQVDDEFDAHEGVIGLRFHV